MQSTGNRSLIDIYRKLVKQLTLFRRRNLFAPMAIPHFADEHSAIADLLATGNGQRRALRDGAHLEPQPAGPNHVGETLAR